MSPVQNDTPPAAPPRRRLQRSRPDRVAAGVCGGLGDYFDVDPVIFRIAFLGLGFVGGASFLLFPAAWLFLPQEGHPPSIGDPGGPKGRRGHSLPIAPLGIRAIVLAGPVSA